MGFEDIKDTQWKKELLTFIESCDKSKLMAFELDTERKARTTVASELNSIADKLQEVHQAERKQPRSGKFCKKQRTAQTQF